MKAFKRLLIVLALAFGGLATTSAFDPAPAQGQILPPGISQLVGFAEMLNNTPAPAYSDVYANEVKWMDASNNCWACTVFDSFVTAVMGMGETASKQMDKGMPAVLVAFGSIFGLFYLGGSFIAGDASDLVSRWKVFWRLCIAVAVAGAWLKAGSYDTTWNYIYAPILEIPIAIQDAVSVSAPDATNCSGGASVTPAAAQTAVNAMRGVVCGAHKLTSDNIAKGLAITQTGQGFLTINNIIHIVTGGFIIVIFAWLMISFPMRFIDVLLRLAIVGIVTPIMVVCAVFKPSRGYCMVGINNVLNAGCQFAFTGIMFKLGDAFFNTMMSQYGGYLTGTADGGDGQMIVGAVILCASAILFGSMVKMAPGIAAEFSQFSASAGGVGAAAEGAARTVVSAPITAGTAVVTGGASLAGAAVGGMVAGSVAKMALGKGVTKGDEPSTGGGG